MKIDINKNFESEYRSSVWKGFDTRQTVTIAAAAVIAAALIWVFWWKLHIEPALAAYAAVVICSPVVFFGFWHSRTGLTLVQKLRASSFAGRTARLKWESLEYQEAYRAQDEAQQERAERIKEERRKIEQKKKYRRERR